MTNIATIKIPVQAETAEALTNSHQLAALGYLVDRIIKPAGADDPLGIALREMARQAREAGLTDEDVDAELAAYNAERRRT